MLIILYNIKKGKKMKTLSLFIATKLSKLDEKYLNLIKQKDRQYAYSSCVFVDEDINSSNQISVFNTIKVKIISSSITSNDTLTCLTQQALLTFLLDAQKESIYFEKLKIMTDILSPNEVQKIVIQSGIENSFSIIDINQIPHKNNLLAYKELEDTLLLNKDDYHKILNTIKILNDTIHFYKSIIKEQDDTIENLQFKSELDDENINDLMKILKNQK